MTTPFGAQGVSIGLRGLATSNLALAAGEAWFIPSGNFSIKPGLYTTVEQLDPLSNMWLNIGATSSDLMQINSDGSSFRVVNRTGFPAGAVITTAGSGMTNGIGATATGVTVTVSAGTSVWSPIVGGAISTTITITNGGGSYTFAPTLVISKPPTGGIPATATCTISAGVINAVTVTNQGAGYTSAPTVTVVPDPRDTTGAKAILTTALTGSGTLTGLLCTDFGSGTALTAVPTLTFSTGGSAATVIMNWTMTAYAGVVGAGGVAYGATGTTIISGGMVTTAGTPTLTNPAFSTGLVRMRPAYIVPTVTAGVIQTNATSLAANANFIIDGGIYQAVPLLTYQTNSISTTTVATYTATMGGVSDFFNIWPA